MKRALIVMIVLLTVIAATLANAQEARRPQIELYAGLGIPLAPEGFKKYYKTGLSLHGQYVIFPSPNMGVCFTLGGETFTVDDAAIKDDFDALYLSTYGHLPSVDGITVETQGSASVGELGIGIRPYLTPPEAATQIFLFGMGTYNALSTETKITLTGPGGTVSAEGKGDENKFGLAGGIGVEIPAGQRFNMVIQGVFRFIFTDTDMTDFLGVTAGLVF